MSNVYWEEATPWIVGWRFVEFVTVIEAACILTETDPAPYRSGQRVLPNDVDTMTIALEQAIVSKKLPPFAAWAYNDFGDLFAVSAEELNPHIKLDLKTSIAVRHLADWAEVRGLPHCWSAPTPSRSPAPDTAEFPDELRAAVEAFQAVRSEGLGRLTKSPRAALLAWLESNKPELSINARDRIATVANWQPAGGAPRTPTG